MHALSDVRYESTPAVGVRWHEFADLFPWVEGKPRDEMRASIEAEGVVEPIVFLGAFILDGRNRYMLARELGIEYPRVDYLGDDPLGFVIAKNLSRRHLTDQQRAMVAGKIAKLPPGRPSETRPDGAVTASEAAELMQVPLRSVVRAKTIIQHGVPELVAEVEANHISLASGDDLARLPAEHQIEVIRSANPAVFNQVVKEVRAQKQAEKKAKRAKREQALAGKQKALPDQKFGLIYADPEWRFDVYSAETGMDRAAENHYPTSSLETIMARDVGAIAAKDAILVLWVPVPHLVEAICVADAWGFCWIVRDEATGHLRPIKDHARYVSHWAWLKESIITGYWNRGKHEILLIFTRGDPVAPAMGDQLPSWLEGEAVRVAATDHSAKPEIFLEWIERMWPNTPKIELNRRGPARPNWSAWGNEAEAEAA